MYQQIVWAQREEPLIVARYHYDMDGYLRIGYELPKDYLYAGLNRIHQIVEDIKRRK